MSKRLIGYGYTNANGVATLDYDAEGNELSSSGYVGQGVGEVDISASAVIDGSTFVSETYEIFDSFIVDIGTTGKANNGAIDDSNLGVQVLDDGTLLSNTGTTNLKRIMNNASVGSDGNDITSAFIMEFDIVSLSGRVGFNFYQTTGTNITDYSSYTMNITAPCHFKMVHDGSKFSIWIDDVKKANNVSHTWNTGRFVFMLSGGYDTSFKYKNFVVYPI